MIRITFTLLLCMFTTAPAAAGPSLEDQLETEIRALRHSLKQAEVQAENCSGSGSGSGLQAELTQILKSTDVEIYRQQGNLHVMIPNADLFGWDGLTIRLEAQMILDMIATAIKLHPEYHVVIENHTADIVSVPELKTQFASLWDLSYFRAKKLLSTFIHEYEVPESRFGLSARAANAPVASNDTQSGQHQNRRTVLIFVAKSE